MAMPSPVLKAPPLTHQQKSFIRHFIQCRRVGEAALRAGYSDKSYGSHLLKSPQIKQAILDSMERAGVDDSLLATKMREGLDATYPAQFYKGDGGVKQAEAPDFHTRREYLSEALKIRGDYAPEKIEQLRKTINISLTIDTGSAQGLLDSTAITELEYDELKKLYSAKNTGELEQENAETEINESGEGLVGQAVGQPGEDEGRESTSDLPVAGEPGGLD